MRLLIVDNRIITRKGVPRSIDEWEFIYVNKGDKSLSYHNYELSVHRRDIIMTILVGF